MNEIIQQRILKIREYMQEIHVDFCIIPTTDYHNSEYVADFFNCREFFSGFDGSSGTLVVSLSDAGLWTDGRYFLQAGIQLRETGISLYKMGEPNVITIQDYIKKYIKPGNTVGFNGKVISADFGIQIKKITDAINGNINIDCVPEESIWKNRPELSANPIWILKEVYAGETYLEKISIVREKMELLHADSLVISKLDDIMWLFNIRGSDIECNPVALSFACIYLHKVILFVQKKACNESFITYCNINKIQIMEYDNVYSYLLECRDLKKVSIDVNNTNYTLYRIISNKGDFLNEANPTELLKACKNPIESKNIRDIYLKDSVIVTKFIYKLLKAMETDIVSEVSAAKMVDDLRKTIPGFLELSFPTISAYKENAAIIHYEPKDKEVFLRNEGMLMVDSGGQYLSGTTDVTRTVVLGDISDEIKEQYTYVALGMLALQNAKFLKGCTGRNLDILARKYLWNIGLDYKHGTGHGVGYVLNVHEGPQSIRPKYSAGKEETEICEGMLLSDEPGVYIEGSHGIRIENILFCKKWKENSAGIFLQFEPLTFVPLDRNAIRKDLMTTHEIQAINAYQKLVFEKTNSYLTANEKNWLEKFTKEL